MTMTVPKSLGSSASLKDQTKDQPVAFRQLLIYPVILSITNYTSVALLNIALDALLPLFLAMPLSAGGLGFAPHTIGYIIGSYGAFSGILQALLFPTFVRIAGVRRVFITGVAVFLPIFALFPIMSLNAREFGVNAFTWISIGSIIGLMTLMDMSYGKFILDLAHYDTPLTVGCLIKVVYSCTSHLQHRTNVLSARPMGFRRPLYQ
ncbi:hypothetical protein C0989_011003 [Termitomyces sp. Mn162]|nr:hypothetical protein C0989_011003 [Termitomyces sp. Mn162]